MTKQSTLLGHEQVTTTERYVHVEDEEFREAVDELGAEWKRAVKARRAEREKGGADEEKTEL